nr:unnamed protein product [Spirometra erinaceieuropaei]
MEHFAEQWFRDNDSPFANADAAFTLSYAILMLNTDQHNPNSKRQNVPMTSQDFKKNLKGAYFCVCVYVHLFASETGHAAYALGQHKGQHRILTGVIGIRTTTNANTFWGAVADPVADRRRTNWDFCRPPHFCCWLKSWSFAVWTKECGVERHGAGSTVPSTYALWSS